MLSNLSTASAPETRKLRQLYLDRSEAKGAIRKVIDAQLENAPFRMLSTTTGFICDRDAQINTFSRSPEYNELLLLTMKHAELQTEPVKKGVEKYFRCVMLSHRWEGNEKLLHEIQGRAVYKLDPVGTVVKLQKFCEVVRDAGYHWAWMDTCCIDKHSNTELQESLNSMFVWYRHSALTIVYLSDVPPSSESGALAKSEWNKRGWTVQEFLAPKVVLFYQRDWTLYLGDHSSNHKKSARIMQELGDATGIDPRALVDFHPDMKSAREKLKWASTRTTTRQEDIAYSLFGIFGVRLILDYGEKKQHALGRLLQEIVDQSGDISALDWVGKSSEFNSCLPADIASYEDPACELSPLSEDAIQTSISSLRNTVAVGSASELYTLLSEQPAPRFAQRRLHLPCMVFRVTEVVRRGHAQDERSYFTYDIKADGLRDLSIKSGEKLVQFSLTRPFQKKVFLVRPWDRRLLELPDETQGVEDEFVPHPASQDLADGLLGEHGAVDHDYQSRALRLIVRLGQQFNALLLIQQYDGGYKRIASDGDIIAQVRDTSSIQNMTVRQLEIL
ncbi:hypothetical protein P692DRAFT_20168015 [Suillus brevipes Sb2]|nr:hypothetical protein P692DRAFT_20168015 [Suillus brevipes Sb2]